VALLLLLSPTVSVPLPVGDLVLDILREGEVKEDVGERECGVRILVQDHEADGVEVHDGEAVLVGEKVSVYVKAAERVFVNVPLFVGVSNSVRLGALWVSVGDWEGGLGDGV